MTSAINLILFWILGTIAGSFACCAADRIKRQQSFVKGRSKCDHCGHVLGIRDLIPIVSYLSLKGKCRYCSGKIESAALWSELLSGGGFVLLAYQFGWNMETIQWAAVFTVLLMLSLVDLRSYIIPDCSIVSLIVIRGMFLPFYDHWLGLLMEGVCGGVILFGLNYLMSQILKHLLHQEVLGGGDLKLMFVMGLYLGSMRGCLALLVSCGGGLLFVCGMKKRRIPFGPCLAIGMMVVILLGENVML